MKNPMETLLGKTFKKELFNVGNQIETMLGGSKNNNAGSDFKVWEIKSKKQSSTSMITLGGSIVENLENYVFNKINNVIFIEYTDNDNSFSVDKITILFDLDYNDFINAKKYYETRKRQTNIRIHKNHFFNMYKNKIEYIA